MRMKKALSIILSLCVLLSFAPYAAASETVTREEFFIALKERGYIEARLSEGAFSDLRVESEIADIAQGALYSNIIDKDDTFRPNEPVTREEAVAACVRSLLYKKVYLEDKNEPEFSDKDDIDIELLPYIEAALSSGLVENGGVFLPKGSADKGFCEALFGKMAKIEKELPLHVGDGSYDADINFVRENLGKNARADELFEDAMKRLLAENSSDEINRAFEEIGMAKGLLLDVRESFITGSYWYDDNGGLIQAHGGGVLYDEKSDTYYWYGEARQTSRVPEHLQRYADWGWRIGVACYSSKDLYNWKYEGLALEMIEDYDDMAYPESDIRVGEVLERPKVIYNEKTGKYVMWMHIDNGWYGYSRAGVAVADSPTGPFSYIESFRPGDKMSRDMSVFVDSDGTAYLYFSTDENGNLACCKLSEDYLSTTDEVTYCIWWKWREAPAVFKYGETYYMITSGCTGWDPNEADYATAPSPTGPWTQHGNPCVGDGADITFGGQSAWVLPVDEKEGKFIFIADIWRPAAHNESGFIWLPIQINTDGALRIEWKDEWTLDSLADNIDTDQGEITTVFGKEETRLPESVKVRISGEEKETGVVWMDDAERPGKYTVEGKLPEFGNAPVYARVTSFPENIIYFVSCGGEERGDFAEIKKAGINNSVPDKAFGKDTITKTEWGYISDHGSGTRKDTDMYASVRYDYYGEDDTPGKGLTYKFSVREGCAYDIYLGVYDPWNAEGRVIDVLINGESVSEGYETRSGAAAFYKTNVVSEDGYLTVSSLKNENSSEDPIISWVVIAASSGGESVTYAPKTIPHEDEKAQETEKAPDTPVPGAKIYRTIKSVKSGLYIAHSAEKPFGMYKRDKEDESQLWNFEKTYYGSYLINLKTEGVSIDVPNGKKDIGLAMVIYQTIRNENQRWLLEKLPDGSYLLRSEVSGLYLTNTDGHLTQEERDETKDQEWFIEIQPAY